MTDFEYDCIVVGAGPAGLLAAKAARQSGLRVVLLERKTDIARMDRMCGQTIVSMNDYYFGDLVAYNEAGKRLSFMNSGFSFSYKGPVKDCMAWHVFSPSGNRLAFGLPEETRTRGSAGSVGLAYDKQVLFESLAEEARESGVEIVTGFDVREVTPIEKGVCAGDGDRSFSGSYLIAADGTNSRIARNAGFNDGRTFYCYLLSKGWYMSGLALPDPDILISSIAYGQDAPGFMFIFPRPYNGEANVVFLTLDPRVDLDGVADYFMSENPFFSSWFKAAEKRQGNASAQYVYSPVPDPYRRRILLAGDAGSCQELENSGAMISGWKAGNAIAAACKEEAVGLQPHAVDEYVRWWRSAYIDRYRHEDYLMNFSLPYVIDRDSDLDYIFSLVKEPLPPCWNPYAAIAHLGGLMGGLMPAIQEERPDLALKIAGMSCPMTEILEQTTQACRPLVELT